MLDLTDIQGNILRGYRFPVVRYTFVTINSTEEGRLWLNEIRDQVTTAEDWGAVPPRSTLNIAFTYAGLSALELNQESLDSFPAEFRQGALARAESLGDRDESGPVHWDDGLGTSDRYVLIHAMFVIYAVDFSSLDERHNMVLSLIPGDGVRVIYTQDAGQLADGMEHFGFRDDISQPPILGGNIAEYPGHGIRQPDGSWRALATGEFLLGQPAQDGAVASSPSPEVLRWNGTYLVYRKLHQKVAHFRQYLKQSASALSWDEELLAARIVGRWRDGTPTMRSPNQKDPALANDPMANNDFSFSDDPKGLRCPLGAHVRRSNPRDALPGGAAAVEGHRMLRRGMPYGPALLSSMPDDGVDRGLVFIAVISNIRSQFEFVQQQWKNSGGFAGLDPAQKDLFVGDNDGTGVMVIPMADFPRRIFGITRFVVVRLSLYLFMPGIQALRFLSEVSDD